MFVLFYTLLFFFKMMELGSGKCIENTGYCVTLCIQNLSSPPQIHVTMGEEGSGSTGPELTTTAVDQFPPPSADAALCAPGDPAAKCEAVARDWLDNVYEVTMKALVANATQAEWSYNTNINAENADTSAKIQEEIAAYDKQAWTDYITKFDLSTFTDKSVIRRLKMLSVLGAAALPDEKLKRLNEQVSGMSGIYGSAKVCPFANQKCDVEKEGLGLDPGLESIISRTTNTTWEELIYVWKSWRDASGKKMRDKFIDYIGLTNEVAKANDLSNARELLLMPYTNDMAADADFSADLEELWQIIKPLYQKLHGYVRYKSKEKWGASYTAGDRDPIPAHISGNMWSQTWQGVYELVAPFPKAQSPLKEVDNTLEGYTIPQMYELSNSFYKSLGMEDMTMSFNTPCTNSSSDENKECLQHHPMIVKPGWDVVCHASAWDMKLTDQKDFRIKMCTDKTLEDLITIHHEMGHIQYFIQVQGKPLQFTDAANPGFHEAIGDTMALSVQTPSHLFSVGLLSKLEPSPQADLNYLMKQALDKVMFLPFAYTVDQFRWALFNGTFNTNEMTSRWWELRERYQGINPPVTRDETDFDPGAKYHVAASTPYCRYFVAHILQYQFYKQMCLDAKQYDPADPKKPLYLCDFSKGEHAQVAGKKMQELLQAGSSKPWPDTLDAMTGSRKMDASALLEYFKPLSDWLDSEIAANQIAVGWESTYKKWIK